MAAPPSKTMKSFDGKWQMNKTLGDNPDPVLSLQGIGWILRKTIGSATITQHIKTSTTPSGATHIQIDQTLTAGLKGTSESRELDWTYRPHSDWLFGDVKGRSRWSSLSKVVEEAATTGKGEAADLEADAKFLVEGWLPESAEGENVVESFVENEAAGWTAWQVWGFADVDGKGRFHVRRVVVRKGSKVERIRLVYDYVGELEG
ncbi:uncharacterized protein EI97DRAFT_389624 [Westerdykella ornata]|uniref:LCCL domain-containing protein n=1 Tax=Westerdykella ornata TaxID=318751 RepID=A0A6A6K1E6_WESOR|nr:uncharacterized protein EI97DRAFT_389624 [Westerdykella ornata]KAF2281189.1 hypothetical protein EI97DRAFT_389624 [Westerdykella ornata]